VPSQDRVVAADPRKLSIRCGLTDVFVRDVACADVYFFEYKLDTVALARGLARVLGDFAPFNATLRRRGNDHFIECGPTGSRFSIAHSDRTLIATLANIDPQGRLELVDLIDARQAWSGGPVLSVRVTHFADGHSALGVSWHHAVGDLRSMMTLLKAWSRAVVGGDYETPLVVEDRDEYLNGTLPAAERIPANLRYMRLPELFKIAAYVFTKARDKRHVTLYFDPEELQRMRAALQSACGQHLSTNDAITAHVCSIIAARDIKPRDRRVATAVDYRNRVNLPENLIGNMVSVVDAACEWGKPADKLAADLRSAFGNSAYMTHHANLRYVASHGGVAKIARFIPIAVDPFAGSLLLSNCSGCGRYDIDFGEGAPSHFLPAGNGPLPWLGLMHEGFGNRGLIVDIELPRAVAARVLDETGLRELHRYRASHDQRPETESNPAWLS
jgi:hypothetical protein